jgi:NitT/TauT family transport system ATP-binding protein
MSTIAARGVTMRFDTQTGDEMLALDDVTLEVEDGGFACIVGASGCGKSTLLNIMAGLIEPTSGIVTVDERPVDGAGADRGMVFQSYTLVPWLRVQQNVEFGPALLGVPKRERAELARQLLHQVGLEDFMHAYPKELSGGMKQRVAIARALANDPEVLLMDEPFGALDALSRASAQRFLTSLWEQHRRTIVFITHDIDEAIYLGDVVHVMSRRPGRIQETIPIDLPRPRSLDDLARPEFGELKRRILELIFMDSPPALPDHVPDADVETFTAGDAR